MATIGLLGIHCSTFLLGILNEYGKVACVKHQQDLFDCECSFTHELKIQSSSLRLMLSWVSQSLLFDHLRLAAELSLKYERVSMSNWCDEVLRNCLSELRGYPCPTWRGWSHSLCLWLPFIEGSLGAALCLAREVHGMKIFWCGHKSCSFNGECDTQDTPSRDLVTKYLLLLMVRT